MTRPRSNPYARPDARTRVAKARGYPARSVFKLEEIDHKWRLFRAGQRVLDLGAAPGSFARYAAERVGASGRVVAVDLQAIKADLGKNVVAVQADVLALASDGPFVAGDGAPAGPIEANAPYDVVLSDMAPNTTGSKVTDQARSFELFMKAAKVAARFGRTGSAFVGKIFMSDDFRQAKGAVERLYETCRAIKPEGTRSVSSELYVVGLNLRTRRS